MSRKSLENNDSSLIEKLRDIFVTTEIFNLRISPIEKIVYTAMGLVGVAFASALIALVFKNGKL